MNHPFESIMAGPFRVVAVTDTKWSGVKCDYCGTPLRWAYTVRGATGSFFVGCDCVQKTDYALYMQAKRVKRDHANALKLANAAVVREAQQIQVDAAFDAFVDDNDLQWAEQMIDETDNGVSTFEIDRLQREMLWLKKHVGDMVIYQRDGANVVEQVKKINAMRPLLERRLPALLGGSKVGTTGKNVTVRGEVTARWVSDTAYGQVTKIRILDLKTGAQYICTSPAELERLDERPNCKMVTIRGTVEQASNGAVFFIKRPKLVDIHDI